MKLLYAKKKNSIFAFQLKHNLWQKQKVCKYCAVINKINKNGLIKGCRTGFSD